MIQENLFHAKERKPLRAYKNLRGGGKKQLRRRVGFGSLERMPA